MPDHEFEREDRVRCKATGQAMTVREVYPLDLGRRYLCEWTGSDGTPRGRLFKADELAPDDTPPAG
jgi:uncharacterized protein YodC (DUF2158 family)